MSKTISDAPLTTREARKRLAPGRYWRLLDQDVHLGYRKGVRTGVWLVRWRSGVGYRQVGLGIADDVHAVGTLDYHAAVKLAREAIETKRVEDKAKADGPLPTVHMAVQVYIEKRDARDSRRTGREVRSDAARRLEKYVIGRSAKGRRTAVVPAPIAKIPLHLLSEGDLARWRDSLPDTFKKSACQRVINDFRAALNAAYEDHKEKLPITLPQIVKSAFKARISHDDEDDFEPIARDGQILSDSQVGAILAAAKEIDAENDGNGDYFLLVLLLAATGSRFSQIARMRVRDVQFEHTRLMVPVSRKGRGTKTGATAVQVGADVLYALHAVTNGRGKGELLLQRWRREQQPGSIRWYKVERVGWQTPSDIVRFWHLVRTRVDLPGIVPYALRHSSIVRGIRSNLPLRLVAALHDTSVAMIERHYARYITDGLEELAARAVIPLVPLGQAD